MPRAQRVETTFIRRSIRGFLVTLLAASALAMGCEDAEGPGGAASPGGGGGSGGAMGTPDKPSTGLVSVDKKTLQGSVDGGTVKLTLLVKSEGAAPASGQLTLEVTSVDGVETVSSTAVAYDLGAGESKELTASVALPAGLAKQADWVRYNVRVREAAASGLRVTRSLQQVLSPYDVMIQGPQKVSVGKPTSFRVKATAPRTGKPLVGVPVGLEVRQGDAVVKTLDGTTGERGDAIFEVTIEGAGDYQVSARATRQGTVTDLLSQMSAVAPQARVLLTTDKPIYQPGQIIHLRALSLSAQSNTPVAGRDAVFEVEDGKGNKIFKKTIATDQHGIAATDFRIGPVVNMGDFKVRAQVGEQKGEKSVNVSRYVLPKLKASVQTDRPWYRAGDTVTGVVDAAYFFGKKVTGGSVKVEALTVDVGENVFRTIEGKTDQEGRFAFSLVLPTTLAGLPLDNGNALVNLRTTITDTAGQTITQEKALTVSRTGVDLALVPDAGALVPGLDNVLDLFASDPLGAPIAGAPVSLALPDGTSQSATTDGYGHAAFTVPAAASGGGSFVAVITPQGEKAVSNTFSFSSQQGQEHVVVRTDRAVYGTGDPVKVQIFCSNPSASVYLDWVNAGQIIDMQTLQCENGATELTTTIDPSMAGSNRIEAYVVDPVGNVVRAGRTIFARNGGALAVSMTTDKPQYEPGTEAAVTFKVTDEKGEPAVAALGVQVVDEAVFALVDAKPGLLRTYFELEQDFAQPSYEIHGPSADFNDLFFRQSVSSDQAEAQAAQTKAQAALAALGEKTPSGMMQTTWPGTLGQSSVGLDPYFKATKDALTPVIKAETTAAVDALTAKGCTAQRYYCDSLGKTYPQALGDELAARIKAFDFWGNPYKVSSGDGWSTLLSLTTNGPDEEPSTGDERSLGFAPTEVGAKGEFGAPSAAGGDGTGGPWNGGAAGGSAAGGATSGVGGAGQAEEGGPRVRKDFPETLYVNPAVITGPDGQATVTIPMADSITTWRVSTLAHSQQGKLGGAAFGITVFQDFFADINFPAQLTRGDEVTFPVAVYNYLDAPQTVKLELSPEAWYTPLGATTLTVDVGPGEVKGVSVPVRVETVGVHTLTVKALGSKKADAVARMVRVVPDGKEISKSQSGSLGAGSKSLDVEFPAGAVPGSPQMHLDVYPAFLSQVVSGMDSMLQTPNGCFEQTTSTTWPNVLVTRYMKDTGQITPAIQMKAESLISAGYQRLLTFEHPGGGFSWFGTQDPAPFLSVTAFGIMEFADMAKVAEIEPTLVSRTAAWMTAQQQPDGSWKGDQTEFFSFQTSTVRNTAFVAWALGAAGEGAAALPAALSYVKSNLTGAEQDTYTLGIVANAFAFAAPNDPFGSELLGKLDGMKKTDGDKVYWSAEGTQTDFYGSGRDADVTSTALVTHAMLKSGGYGPTVGGALGYLTASKDPQGNFGSTQATIWTLKTLLLAAEKGTESAVGTLDVQVDGKPFTTLNLTAEQGDVMHTVDLASLSTVGQHSVSLSFVGTGKVSYNLVSAHNVPWADLPQEPTGPLSIDVAYDRQSLSVDETVQATVTVTNNTAATQNMVMLTLGIAPGFAVMTEDLDAYLKDGTLSGVETTGKQLILYVSKVPASKSLTFVYRLLATMPVKAEDGGAAAYPYYQPDEKSASKSTSFEVSGK